MEFLLENYNSEFVSFGPASMYHLLYWLGGIFTLAFLLTGDRAVKHLEGVLRE